MEAGRQLDAIVAEKVMGWANVRHDWHTEGYPDDHPIVRWIGIPEDGQRYNREILDPINAAIRDQFIAGERDEPHTVRPVGNQPVPPYSTDIAAAWPIVEKLGLWVFPDGGKWCAGRPRTLSSKSYVPDMYGPDDVNGTVDGHLEPLVWAATAPEAICRVALEIVGAEVPA